jgi:hypothetical protein
MQITVLTYSPGPMGNEANMWTATFAVDGVATFKAIEAGNGGILQFEPLSSDPTQSQEQRATIRRMEEWGQTLPKAIVEGEEIPQDLSFYLMTLTLPFDDQEDPDED